MNILTGQQDSSKKESWNAGFALAGFVPLYPSNRARSQNTEPGPAGVPDGMVSFQSVCAIKQNVTSRPASRHETKRTLSLGGFFANAVRDSDNLQVWVTRANIIPPRSMAQIQKVLRLTQQHMQDEKWFMNYWAIRIFCIVKRLVFSSFQRSSTA